MKYFSIKTIVFDKDFRRVERNSQPAGVSRDRLHPQAAQRIDVMRGELQTQNPGELYDGALRNTVLPLSLWSGELGKLHNCNFIFSGGTAQEH